MVTVKCHTVIMYTNGSMVWLSECVDPSNSRRSSIILVLCTVVLLLAHVYVLILFSRWNFELDQFSIAVCGTTHNSTLNSEYKWSYLQDVLDIKFIKLNLQTFTSRRTEPNLIHRQCVLRMLHGFLFSVQCSVCMMVYIPSMVIQWFHERKKKQKQKMSSRLREEIEMDDIVCDAQCTHSDSLCCFRFEYLVFSALANGVFRITDRNYTKSSSWSTVISLEQFFQNRPAINHQPTGFKIKCLYCFQKYLNITFGFILSIITNWCCYDFTIFISRIADNSWKCSLPCCAIGCDATTLSIQISKLEHCS